jgi:hypothetical protein
MVGGVAAKPDAAAAGPMFVKRAQLLTTVSLSQEGAGARECPGAASVAPAVLGEG